MNCKQLRYVIALEEEMSVSLAARKLGVSQSTLSKHLSSLEQELGAPIFIRNQKKLTATSYGKIYIDAARRILQLYHFAEQNIATVGGTKRTDLYLGLPDTEDHRLLNYILTQFKTHFPLVTLHIQKGTAAELLALLNKHNSSAVLTDLVGPVDNSFHVVPLFEDELWFAISAADPGLAGTEQADHPGYLEPDMLDRCAFILPFASSPVRTIADSLFSARRITPHITCEIDSAPARLELVRQGFGCTFLTRTEMIDDEEIMYLRPPECYTVKKAMVYKNDKSLSAPAAWCAELFRDYYAI